MGGGTEQTVLGLVAAGVGLAVVPEAVGAVRRRGVALRPIREARHRIELEAAWRCDQDRGPLADFLTGIGAAR